MEKQERLDTMDYARSSPMLPRGLSMGEQFGLVAAILPLILLLLFHLVVVVSPWTVGALCRAADNGVPISPAASKLTNIGALLHFDACLISLLFGPAGFVLFVWALIQRNTRSLMITGIMTVCSAVSAMMGDSYAFDLAGF